MHHGMEGDCIAYALYEASLCKPIGEPCITCNEVPIEHAIAVFINDAKAMEISCTPSRLPELLLGRLLTEGLIRDLDDLDAFSFSDDLSQAWVSLKEPPSAECEESWQVVTTCSKEAHGPWSAARSPLEKVKPLPWQAEDIFALSQDFADDTPIHRATYGSHSCRLAVDGKLIYCCEDLGRHNAFDKVVGCALRDGIDLGKSIVFTSGRIPVDMVNKAIRAGVPILASKAVPTNRTVELARMYDLTLICSARPDSMKVFSDPLGCALKV